MTELNDLHQIKTDVALVKQELYYLKNAVKDMQNIFKWLIMLFITALVTAGTTLILNGGLA